MNDRYTRDLTDEQWDLIRQFLPTEQDGPGRPMELQPREVVNAILYIVRTGCQWDNLPNDLPNANSVYYHYRNITTENGVSMALGARSIKRFAKRSAPTVAEILSPLAELLTVKASRQQNLGARESGGERGYDAGKGVWGRKRHVIVDTVGNVLDVVVHAADIQDRDQDRDGARLLFKRLWEETQDKIQKIWADGACRGDLIDWVQESLDAVLDVVERDEDQDGFEVLPRRWVVERTFAWLGRYRRLSKDYERCTRSSEGVIYIASIQTMAKRIAASN